MWTIQKILEWTTDYFKKFNIEWPHLEAEILLAAALNLKRIDLYTNYERVLSKEELAKFKEMILRRSRHEPIAYITGIQPFMGLDFMVNPSVLIPRPETEKLVEIVIDLIKNWSLVIGHWSLVDVGTGSGAIAVSLAKYLPNVSVIGIDSSGEAIKVAQENAKKHQVEERCQFIIGNMFEPFNNVAAKPWPGRLALPNKADLIVSNPPYIPTAEIDKLQVEVKEWEPHSALDGREDGLFYIQKLIEEGPNYLKEEGFLVLEFGIGQETSVKELAQQQFKEIKIVKDHSGIDRVLIASIKV